MKHLIKPQYLAIFFNIAGLLGLLVLVLSLVGFLGESHNGFNLAQHKVPLNEIRSGGPSRDGIPAIMNPSFILGKEATFLGKEDRVLGIKGSNESKAYPIKILNWHEIVNDTLEGNPIVITYCPLCGTGIGFERMIQGHPTNFGVSGLLYQSDLLMYDHKTESLWSQIAMEAVTGPLTGEKLRHVFLEHTTWYDWFQENPDTLVLSKETGHSRDYDRDPYLGYAKRPDLMFSTKYTDSRFHSKEWVVGIEVNGVFKAYPFSLFQATFGSIKDKLNGQTLMIRYDLHSQNASATDDKGHPVPTVMAYWFAWYAFHPDTLVYRQ